MTGPGDTPPTAADKRDAERFRILGELHGEVMVFQPTTVREISRSGARLETSFPLQLNSLHEIRLTLGPRSVVVKGRVAHCSVADVDQGAVRYRSGIEFVEPSDRVVAAINEFIDAMADVRAATGSSSP